VTGDGPRVYLAGPDVFLPDALAIADAKRAICADQGLVGCFPLDNRVDAPPGASRARAIHDANLAMMAGCVAVIANLTPFRGPNADDGTAFEVGWFAARGRPIAAYLNDDRPLFQRTPTIGGRDMDGLEVEDFGWPLNLMLVAAVEAAGGQVVAGAAIDRHRDLGLFRIACAALAPRLRRSWRPSPSVAT
jgi:nucleoside 2-deoxyribosyltransferase